MQPSDVTPALDLPAAPAAAAQHLLIEYCTLCRWQLRANWLAQEALSTFADEIDRVSLQPSSGGVFRVWLNNELVWDRVRDQGFPEARELKQRLRDLICPERDLGHIDRASNSQPAADS